ncbi:MAG: hypothetical protein KatS3mg009_3239 [Acidimicrobiia bacterium]|nr:MAG: hypothetical protein KatS3mg009_3239 [Acidimicrobiia bacterium]
MPTYEYRCTTCGEVFERRRPMAESAEPATCPAGHPGARRLLSVFATVSGEPSAPAAPAAPCGAACACHPG